MTDSPSEAGCSCPRGLVSDRGQCDRGAGRLWLSGAGVAGSGPALRGEHQCRDVHHPPSRSARLLAAPPTGMLVQRLGGGGSTSRAADRCSDDGGVRRRAQLAAAAVPGAGQDRLDDVLRLIAGPDDPDQPARRARRVSGLFAGAFLVGSVAGLCWGNPDRRTRPSCPVLRNGALLIVAATVVMVGLSKSELAAPSRTGRTRGDVRGGVAAQGISLGAAVNFATGWSLFGLRFALVPLFVEEVLDRQPPPRRRAGPGRIRRRQRGGGDVQRPGSPIGSGANRC